MTADATFTCPKCGSDFRHVGLDAVQYNLTRQPFTLTVHDDGTIQPEWDTFKDLGESFEFAYNCGSCDEGVPHQQALDIAESVRELALHDVEIDRI